VLLSVSHRKPRSMSYSSPSYELQHSTRRPAGSGVVVLWIMMALTLAWFIPYATEVSIGIIGAG
jgi:hypothetical protein